MFPSPYLTPGSGMPGSVVASSTAITIERAARIAIAVARCTPARAPEPVPAPCASSSAEAPGTSRETDGVSLPAPGASPQALPPVPRLSSEPSLLSDCFLFATLPLRNRFHMSDRHARHQNEPAHSARYLTAACPRAACPLPQDLKGNVAPELPRDCSKPPPFSSPVGQTRARALRTISPASQTSAAEDPLALASNLRKSVARGLSTVNTERTKSLLSPTLYVYLHARAIRQHGTPKNVL
jgi:hypothetical protein